MSTHLEETLQRDLERIHSLLSSMGRLGVRNLQDGLTALRTRNRMLAQIIILRDQRMDAMEQENDRLCLEFILRHQPVAGHLRFVYTAQQVNFELERVGDYAESIARQILRLLEMQTAIPAGLFTEIAEVSIAMLRDAVIAFVTRDAALAEVTAQIEEKVDTLRTQLSSQLVHMLEAKQIPVEALTPLMTIARRFERVSDQAKSICQETIYICTGEYVRHHGSQLFRVLFVDDHGGFAQMAELLGKSLNRVEFSFASASVDPALTDPAVAQQAGALGFDPLPERPKRLQDVADVLQYQVLIALTPAAKAALPGPLRKSVHFEWPTPAGAPTSEPIRRFLAGQVSELVDTILGEDHS
jgi:phosphate transport system protein